MLLQPLLYRRLRVSEVGLSGKRAVRVVGALVCFQANRIRACLSPATCRTKTVDFSKARRDLKHDPHFLGSVAGDDPLAALSRIRIYRYGHPGTDEDLGLYILECQKLGIRDDIGKLVILQGPEGYFKIVDRKKDMILVSGFNVFPNEIEDVIASHPKVLEVAVIGVPDAKSTEAVKVFIVKSDPSLTEEEVRAYCAEQLTGYKRPRHIEFRDDLPKSNVGKILRRELRDEELKKQSS